MPYRNIFQSGVLFLAYRFGLPVIATDVGSLREDVIEGKTGHICKPEDPDDLAKTIGRYFASDLFKDLENRRQQIRDYAHQRYSWSRIGEMTRKVYEKVMKE
jgi:glycosyltransferase involved in cell wall biosynthesis